MNINCGIAQLVEQDAVNVHVLGSIPSLAASPQRHVNASLAGRGRSLPVMMARGVVKAGRDHRQFRPATHPTSIGARNTMTDQQLIELELPANEVEWLVKEAAQRGVTLTELASHLLSESIYELSFKEDFIGDGE